MTGGRIRRRWAVALALGLVLVACGDPGPDLEKDRVVILVVDGLRPDYVTEAMMPRLNELAERGVRGMAHHAVFPTVTRVNGPSIFTGRYPSGHGLMGNSVYLADIEPSRTLDMSDRADVVAIDDATGGTLLTAPSLGELLAGAGLTFFAASSGSTGSGTFMNHKGVGAGLVHHEFTLPESLEATASVVLGPPPSVASGTSSVPLVARAIDALLLMGLDGADADVMAAWLTEPDGTAHRAGIGAPETLEVLAGVDAEIGRLLDGLEERGVLARTNIFVTSDHGFSTQTGTVSISRLLVDAGLKASAGSMDVVVAGGAIHVQEGGEDRIGAIVRLLQTTEWIGPVFTRGNGADSEFGAYPGTIGFAAVGWEHERSADIMASAGWTDGENEFGFRGEVLSPGNAGHGSASPWDIRSAFVAVGPAIKTFVASPVATGNIDLVPTVLELMGVEVPAELDGRVLEEVLESGPFPGEVEMEPALIQTAVDVEGIAYSLTIYRSRVGSTVYFDGFDVVRAPADR